MRKNILLVGLIVMILINAFLIFLLFSKRPMPQRGKEDIKTQISEKLQLNNEQQERYFQLTLDHRNKINNLDRRHKGLLKRYFDHLKVATTDTLDSEHILTQLTSIEKEKTEATYNHFEDLKNLLDNEQLIKFDQIIDDILRVLLNEQKNPPPPRDK